MSEKDGFLLSIYTSSEQFFADKVKAININAYYGKIGLLVNHVDFASIIRPGSFMIEKINGDKIEGVIFDGIIFFNKKEAIVITEKALFTKDINKKFAQTRLEDYQKQITDKSLTKKQKEVIQNQIRYYQTQLNLYIEQI